MATEPTPVGCRDDLMVAETRLAVIIPAHNEAGNIGAVIHDARRHAPQAEIVVVDDGSTDATAPTARAAGATVISLLHNLGISGAVQTGYRYAIREHDAIVRLDGDGQHDARYVHSLLAPIHAGSADFVIGSRFAGSGVYTRPFARAVGIRFFSFLVTLVTRQHVSDPTSGFHACTADAARFLARNMPSDYPEIEGLILLCRAGFRVQEAPVVMRPRQGGVSSIGRARAVYYVLKVTLAVLIGLLRARPPKESTG
jgi:glycosyltransferase involved in cell wall biosynthesis